MTENGPGRGRHPKPAAASPLRPGIAAIARHSRIALASAVAAVAVGVAASMAVTPAPGGILAAAWPAGGANVADAGTTAGVTELAVLRSDAPGSASPGGPAVRTVPASWYGYRSVLPIIGRSVGWLEVRLAQRPNGSTAWIPAADATLSSTPYQIVISRAAARLTLYERGQEVFSAPVGVGTASDPTPTGQYFVAFREPPPPDPGYGPFILATSDHSRAINDWEGSGDAVIGIHGPLGASAAIGKTGAHISHGCIRMQLADQRKLAGIPAGTPVTVTG